MSQHASKFLPSPQPGTKPYWEGCKQHQLLLQKCGDCGRFQFYPRTICTSCSANTLDWVASSGAGTVVSWTIVRHPESEAYADDVPYVIALIKLQEGPTMMSQIIDSDVDSIRSGLAVNVSFQDWTDEISMPVFRVGSNDDA
jgi:uncharacterized OB-fold protein